jgi:hypothetical protein
MTIGIDPTVDFACKRVPGSPEHPAITLHFLNAVLRLLTPIRQVRILNPTIERSYLDWAWSDYWRWSENFNSDCVSVRSLSTRKSVLLGRSPQPDGFDLRLAAVIDRFS